MPKTTKGDGMEQMMVIMSLNANILWMWLAFFIAHKIDISLSLSADPNWYDFPYIMTAIIIQTTLVAWCIASLNKWIDRPKELA